MAILELEKLNSKRDIVNKSSLILAFISGVLLFLSFPKFGIGLVAWIALIPLFHAIKERNVSESLMPGFITGLCYYVGVIYWVVYAIVKYGNLPIFTGILAMLLLSAYLGIYVVVFCSGVAYLNQKNIPLVISAPILWTSLEYVKSSILTGFPWANLAHSQYSNLHIIQFADITGIYGITFFIVFINAVIYEVLFNNANKKKIIFSLSIAALVILMVYSYGAYRINHINKLMNHAKSIGVNLIQGNIDQGVKWNEEYKKETIETYRTLSLEKTMRGNGLIIWPETAVPLYFQDINDYHRQIIGIAKSSNNWLLIGSPGYAKESNVYAVSNSAFLISPDGEIKGQYNKVHLVPFGEYVPLRKYLPFIDKIVVGIGDFRAGNGYYPLIMDQTRMGVLICYEGIFPEAGRKYKEAGAGFLVNITNDAWYGRTSAPYQHISMVIFRSIENRLYLVRAANTGITGIIDATGKISSSTEIFRKASLLGRIKILNIKTIYSRYGDIFAYFCLVSILLLLFIPKKRGE